VEGAHAGELLRDVPHLEQRCGRGSHSERAPVWGDTRSVGGQLKHGNISRRGAEAQRRRGSHEMVRSPRLCVSAAPREASSSDRATPAYAEMLARAFGRPAFASGTSPASWSARGISGFRMNKCQTAPVLRFSALRIVMPTLMPT